jgi:hypothetical protein
MEIVWEDFLFKMIAKRPFSPSPSQLLTRKIRNRDILCSTGETKKSLCLKLQCMKTEITGGFQLWKSRRR